MLRCNMRGRALYQISGHLNLVYLKATNCIIFNQKITNFTTICGINGIKTVRNSKNFCFQKIVDKNNYKIVSESPIDVKLASKDSSR